MTELIAKPAAMVMTLEITRAATGLTETVQVVCTPIATEELPAQPEGETQCP